MIGTGIGLGLAGYRINPAGGPIPVLDINFRDYKTFNSSIGPTASFSRASTATYFDETGVMRTAAINAGRINHVYNGTSWVAKGGLLEEQRTNSAQSSEDFSNAFWIKSTATISANQAVSPGGNTTADLLYGSSTGSARGLYYSSPGTTTISVFAKSSGKNWITLTDSSAATSAWFNLSTGAIGTVGSGYTASIQNCGNGWFRCSLTKSTNFSYFQILLADSDNTLSFTANGTDGALLWGAQAEAGALTSYIPNLTSGSTTRSADVMQLTGTDFSGVWNANEGTIAVEFEHGPASGDSCLYMVAGGSTDPQSTVFITGGNIESSGYNGASIYSFNLGAWSSSTAKIATAFKTNDFAASLNGGAVATDTSGTLSTAFNRLQIGRIDWGGGAYWNGHIARLRYWNTRLDNATLRYLST